MLPVEILEIIQGHFNVPQGVPHEGQIFDRRVRNGVKMAAFNNYLRETKKGILGNLRVALAYRDAYEYGLQNLEFPQDRI